MAAKNVDRRNKESEDDDSDWESAFPPPMLGRGRGRGRAARQRDESPRPVGRQRPVHIVRPITQPRPEPRREQPPGQRNVDLATLLVRAANLRADLIEQGRQVPFALRPLYLNGGYVDVNGHLQVPAVLSALSRIRDPGTLENIRHRIEQIFSDDIRQTSIDMTVVGGWVRDLRRHVNQGYDMISEINRAIFFTLKYVSVNRDKKISVR